MSKGSHNFIDDTKLWQRLINGEKDIIEIFYRKYYDLLLNYGLKCCPDKELVKDCIQDIFVKMHKSSQLQPTEYVRAYLMKSLRNLIADKLAQVKRKTNIDDLLFCLETDDESLSRLFEKNDKDIQLSRQLLEMYNKLPKNQRIIIYLRYIKGLSHKEIAEIMDINRQSSMNLINRALESMRKHFSKIITFFL